MLLHSILAGIALVQAGTGDRPPRPTDEQLLARLVSEAPAARVLSVDFRDPARGDGRVGCGVAEIHGHVEPFTVFTGWREAEETRIGSMQVTIVGADGQPEVHTLEPPEPEPAHWSTHTSLPTHEDRDDDGDIDRHDRNFDVLRRQMALNLCKHIAKPEGATWPTELEPDPDPARAERNRRLARATVALLFGGAARSAPPAERE